MKFTCNRASLVQAAASAARATASRSPVPALEGLLIEAASGGELTISGYDLKTGIVAQTEAEVAEAGAVVLNARLFGDIIRRLPGEDVTVTVGASNNTNIVSGVSSFDIVGSPAEDYPSLPSAEGQTTIEIDGKVLRDIISQTIFAVADNDARPVLTGALIETEGKSVTIVAHDRFRLALRREELLEETEITSFIVPGTALAEAERIASSTDSAVEIVVGEKHVIFKLDGTLLISRRLEGEFLNYRASIPQSHKYALNASRRELTDAVERVSLIISDKAKSPVRCTFGDHTLELLSASAFGTARDECAISGDGEKLEIGFNNRYLLDALKAAPADDLTLCLSGPEKPCIVVPAAADDDSFLYMVLPVRLSSNEANREG
ncbi:MAG: DNA polymerase III subunit beta [Oscillospiraceae bacterium]|jgi:DNA polymerase-3 subunit beta|nr:DNA polymerase III subunit beta [Oscillospiraceae bacterium]